MIDTAAQCSSFSDPGGNSPSMLWFITLSTWGPAVLVCLESTLYIYYTGVKVSAVVPQWQNRCAQCFCAQLCHHFVNMKCFDPIPEQRGILFNVSITLTYWQRGYNPGCSQQSECWEMIKCKAFGFNSLESLHHLHVVPVLPFCLYCLCVKWFSLTSANDPTLGNSQFPQLPPTLLG